MAWRGIFPGTGRSSAILNSTRASPDRERGITYPVRRIMTSAEITVVEADLDQPAHQQAILELTDSYACDPMGGATPLSPAVRGALISGLRRHATTRVFLAFASGEAVGIAS